MSVLFVSLDTFKEYLPVKPGVTGYDSLLLAVLHATGEQIETWCDRRFARKTDEVEYHNSRDCGFETYDLFGGSTTGTRDVVEEQILTLRRYPVDEQEPVRVWWDPARQFPDTAELPPEAFWIDAETGRLFVRWRTRGGRRFFKVRYTGGYAASGSPPTLEHSLPAAVKQAFIVQAIHNWTKTKAQNIGVLADRTDNRDPRIDAYTRYSVMGGLVPEAQHLLAPYRRMRVAVL